MDEASRFARTLGEFIARLVVTGPNSTVNGNHYQGSLIGFTSTIQSRTLEDSIVDLIQSKRETWKRIPLVDIIESPKNIKVVAFLPGIKIEDVSYIMENGILNIKITKRRTIYKKEIPCRDKIDEIVVKSSTLNNSVLELTFGKKAK